jgi:hypothetical protein
MATFIVDGPLLGWASSLMARTAVTVAPREPELCAHAADVSQGAARRGYRQVPIAKPRYAFGFVLLGFAAWFLTRQITTRIA